MNTRTIFESYIGKDCPDYLIQLRSKLVDSAISIEPEASSWTIYIDEDEKEVRENELDIYNLYSEAFEKLKDESTQLISDLCYELTYGKSLYELLEDVFYDYISKDIYNAFHNLCKKFNDSQYNKEELEKLNQLAKSSKELFLTMITPTQ